jgi:hypothetical protein
VCVHECSWFRAHLSVSGEPISEEEALNADSIGLAVLVLLGTLVIVNAMALLLVG